MPTHAAFALVLALAVLASEPAKACDRNQFVIKYDVGSAQISQKDKVRLKKFARTAKHRTQVCLFGQADAQGDPEFNRLLAAERVNGVRDYLLAHGIEEESFSIGAQGESFTLWGLLSADTARERSVTVSHD
ncbi:MAG: OmpA family protein [Neomegalonema sp.]